MGQHHPREPVFHQGVAQLAEHVVWDHEAGGSSPLTLTILIKRVNHTGVIKTNFKIWVCIYTYAGVAQVVERRFEKPKGTGAAPVPGTIKIQRGPMTSEVLEFSGEIGSEIEAATRGPSIRKGLPKGHVLYGYQFFLKKEPSKWTQRQTQISVRVFIGLKDLKHGEIAELLNGLGLSRTNGEPWRAHHIQYLSQNVERFTRNVQSLARLRTRQKELLRLSRQQLSLPITPTPVEVAKETTPKRLNPAPKKAEVAVEKEAASPTRDTETAQLLEKVDSLQMSEKLREKISLLILKDSLAGGSSGK